MDWTATPHAFKCMGIPVKTAEAAEMLVSITNRDDYGFYPCHLKWKVIKNEEAIQEKSPGFRSTPCFNDFMNIESQYRDFEGNRIPFSDFMRADCRSAMHSRRFNHEVSKYKVGYSTKYVNSKFLLAFHLVERAALLRAKLKRERLKTLHLKNLQTR